MFNNVTAKAQVCSVGVNMESEFVLLIFWSNEWTEWFVFFQQFATFRHSWCTAPIRIPPIKIKLKYIILFI